jgi:hypothetical protein
MTDKEKRFWLEYNRGMNDYISAAVSPDEARVRGEAYARGYFAGLKAESESVPYKWQEHERVF